MLSTGMCFHGFEDSLWLWSQHWQVPVGIPLLLESSFTAVTDQSRVRYIVQSRVYVYTLMWWTLHEGICH